MLLADVIADPIQRTIFGNSGLVGILVAAVVVITAAALIVWKKKRH